MKTIYTFIFLCSSLLIAPQAFSQEQPNPNLLIPVVSPGSSTVGDIQRTRQYYDTLEMFSARKNNEEQIDVTADYEIKLPPRKIKGAPTVYIKTVNMDASAIFSPQEVNQIKNLVEGKHVTAEDLNNLINVINRQYIKKNVITAKAYLPKNALKNGVLRVVLIEAKIGKIHIENNKYNRTFYLKRQLSQKEGEVLDVARLEGDLRTFNQNARGALLKARLKAGEAYGQTDVIIETQEEFPVHLTGSFDNFGSRTSGLNRLGAIVGTDSVIGIQDRLSLAYNWAPSSWTAYVDYNVPINKKDTRLGISYMYGDSEISKGPFRDFDIHSDTQTYSLYLSHPFKKDERQTLNGVSSLNYKTSRNDIYGINYTRMNDTFIGLGFNYQYRWDKAFIYTSHALSNGYINDRQIDESMYFIKYNTENFGIRYFDNGIALTAKLSGQYTPQDVPFLEQAQVGGMSTVRGYSESLLMGESSFVASVEALWPIPFLPEETPLFTLGSGADKKQYSFNFKNNIKFATFLDTGGVFRHHFTETGQDFITGVGVGLRMSLTKYFQSRIYWAYALSHDKVHQPASRWHFDIISAPF